MQIERLVFPSHETVLRCSDPVSGLHAYIAVHDTTLGPGLGGCRMWPYDRPEDALADVLRLSKGMTAKAALAGVPFGGGKSVIVGDPHIDKTPQRLHAFGRFVAHLSGRYIAGEDVGMTPADMAEIARETPYVVGLPETRHGSGDPSPVTAAGVFACMERAARARFGAGSLAGLTVAVQGLGHVGLALVERLHVAGARVLAADIDAEACDRARARFAATILPADDIATAGAEIFAPCALGGALDDATVAELRAAVVCGSANNQLARPDLSGALHRRGILYCPDYVVNAGGLINVAREALKIENPAWVTGKLAAAVDRFDAILARAAQAGRPPVELADAMVEDILARARRTAHAS